MRKSFIVIATGVALTAASLTSAQAAPAPARTSDASSQHSTRSCSDYPGSVYTTTTLDLEDHSVRRGRHNVAIVHVRSQAQGNAQGSVMVTVQPTDGAGSSATLYQRVDDGDARVSLPRHFAAGRYALRATYIPKDCSKWAASESGVAYLTITKRRHHHHHNG